MTTAPSGRFLSTPSARRATPGRKRSRHPASISIHALREEGDSWGQKSALCTPYFYPRPPRGGRPHRSREWESCGAISIHALREEGDLALHDALHDVAIISIHALREEGDQPLPRGTPPPPDFYPRPPRGGRHHTLDICINRIKRFLSTPSSLMHCAISIHALREEGDDVPLRIPAGRLLFLSTPSARRATAVVVPSDHL